jgi:hypothetical protein
MKHLRASLFLLLAVGVALSACDLAGPLTDDLATGSSPSVLQGQAGFQPALDGAITVEVKTSIVGGNTVIEYAVLSADEAFNGFLLGATCAQSWSPESGKMVTRLAGSETITGVHWPQAIPSYPASNPNVYEIVVPGTPQLGTIRAAVRKGGTWVAGDIPGPVCAEGPVSGSISGTVYADANGDGTRDYEEAGIPGVLVRLLDASSDEVGTVATDADGAFSFGDLPFGTYHILLPDEDGNVLLLATHTLTEAPLSPFETTGDVSGLDFGLFLDVARVTLELQDGTIQTNGRSTVFWSHQFRAAVLGSEANVSFTRQQLLEFLDVIEAEVLLPGPFSFGSSDQERLSTALGILAPPIKSERERLFSELLAAQLNVVIGRGTDSEALNYAILAYAEAVADGGGMAGKSAAKAALSTDSSTADMLSAFNGTGGGVGGF